MKTHLSLFSGIGGLDLAGEWAGFTTVGQCEWADYPTKVLEKHWPDVPRWRDIRTLRGESFYDRTGLRTVDIVSGGFPCQPFSVAGKQRGKTDERYLWPEMLRVIRELAPHYVIGENVPGIINLAGRTVCEDLERAGYAVAVFNFEAAAVGAPHRRERVFFVAENTNRLRRYCAEREKEPSIWKQWEFSTRNIQRIYKSKDVAYAKHIGFDSGEISRGTYAGGNANKTGAHAAVESAGLRCGGRGCKPMADTESTKFRRHGSEQDRPQGGFTDGGWWSTEPDVGRVAHGISSRVDRLKCLGNAVVPQQAYPIFQAIADIMDAERMNQ